MDKNDAIYPILVGAITAIVELRETKKITVVVAYREIAKLLKTMIGTGERKK